MKKTGFILGMLFWSVLHAEMRVAFFSAFHQDGSLIQFEPNGRFSHVALFYKGSWIHADPVQGVVQVPTLNAIGNVALVLRSLKMPDPDDVLVFKYLGLPYDRTFRWESERSTYCAKLVAKFLGIKPKPMRFEGEGWEHWPHLPRGELGLSPDDLYESLIKMEFTPATPVCNEVLSRKLKHGEVELIQ